MSLPHRSPDPIDMAAVRQVAQRAEALGFRDLWVTENTLDHVFSFDPRVILTYAAAVTTRIRLGVAVVVLPVHHPATSRTRSPRSTTSATAARSSAWGSAATTTTRNSRCRGAPRAAAFAKAWRSSRRSGRSRRSTTTASIYRLDGDAMVLKPVQKPHPPIWIGGDHPDAVRRAAALADGWMGSGGSSKADFAKSVPILRAELEKVGRDPRRFRSRSACFCRCTSAPTSRGPSWTAGSRRCIATRRGRRLGRPRHAGAGARTARSAGRSGRRTISCSIPWAATPSRSTRWRTVSDSAGCRDEAFPRRRMAALCVLVMLAVGIPLVARPAPDGQMTWGIHISLAPTWFDPAETTGIVTPFMVMYALHDAMVKPLPGNPLAPSLAESWTVSPDGLAYEFVLRKGTRFHNGDPVTAEDVKFSFERYRGAASKTFKERVAAVEIAGPGARALPPQGAVARLPHVLLERDRRGLDRAQEVRREGRRRRIQEASDRRRALPLRLVHAGRGARAGGRRPVLAEDAAGEAARLQGDSRPVHALRRAQARRDRRQLLDDGVARRGAPAHARASRSSPRSRTTPTGSTSSTSGTRNRRGTTAACASPPTTPSTGRRINQAETLGFSRMTYSLIPSHFEFFWQPPAIPHDLGAREAAPRGSRISQRLRRRGLHLRRRARGHRASPSPTTFRPPAFA